MAIIEHHLRLKSARHYGRRVPPEAFGAVLQMVPKIVRSAIAMRTAGISHPSGRRTGWLKAASDVRFIDHYGDDDTILVFEAPRLGESAEELYEQPDMFRELPPPQETGFDLLGDVVTQIRARNAESDLFDAGMLDGVARMRKGINGTFQEADFWGSRFTEKAPAIIDETVIATAEEFKKTTPPPQAVRLSGHLDLIRASTLGFGLELKSGEMIRGVLRDGSAEDLQRFFHKDVVLSGHAIYRPTGSLLRVEGSILGEASDADAFFSTVPAPRQMPFSLKQVVQEQRHKRGLASIIGKWPGDETDEEIDALLREVS